MRFQILLDEMAQNEKLIRASVWSLQSEGWEVWMDLLPIVSPLRWEQCKVVQEGKSVFQDSCTEGRGQVRGEHASALIRLVFPFIKHIADSMDFDRSLQLLPTHS